MEILFSHVLGTAWISASSEKFQKHLTLKCVCVLIFFLTMGIYFSHFLGIVWVSASPKIFEKPITLECLFLFFFPYFSRIMGIHFSHVLEIVWISPSIKIFKKPINLKCLCFPILFPYYGNPLFPCVGNCMDFCFQQKNPETLNFEMFMFSHIFSLLCEFTFLIFWELYVLMPHMKYVRNP